MDSTDRTNVTEYTEWELIDSGNAADISKDEEARDFAVNRFAENNANILLSAAAGSGKTYTLVERIANRIAALPEGKHVSSFAVVTFTKAAAAELRDRIGKKLSERIIEASENGDAALAEKLYVEKLLLPGAMIGTIDSFALDVVKNNFAGLGISPDLTIDDDQVKKFRDEAAETVLDEYYALDREDPKFKVLSALMDTYCSLNSDDKLKKDLFDAVLGYAETVPNPAKWLRDMPKSLEFEGDVRENPWYKKLSAVVQERIGRCIVQTGALKEIVRGRNCRFTKQSDIDQRIEWLDSYADRMRYVAGKLADDSGEGPALFTTDFFIDKKTPKWPNVGRNSDDAEKSFSALCLSERKRISDGYDAIAGDLNRIFSRKKDGGPDLTPQEKERIVRKGFQSQKEYTALVCEIAARIEGMTLEKSKQRGVYSFSQIAHFALEILNDGEVPNDGVGTLKPSAAALGYRQMFSEIYVDEYQDTSELQEYIIYLVSGIPEGDYNLFMVGDIKQSIYGFRNAKPDLFLSKFDRYMQGLDNGVLKILSRNFRSRKAVLDGVNEVFFKVMTAEAAGIDYRNGHKLNYGAAADYDPNPVTGDPLGGANEMILCEWIGRPRGEGAAEAPEGADDASEGAGDASAGGPSAASEGADNASEGSAPGPVLDKKDLEPAAVADKICSLFENGFKVFDKGLKRLRPLSFGDICIISYKHKALQEQRRFLAGIGFPVDTGVGSMFFDAREVRDIINLLRIVDNPRNDVPLAALLMSSYFGFDEEFLAAVRSAGIKAGGGRYENLWVYLHLACGREDLLGCRGDREIPETSRPAGEKLAGDAAQVVSDINSLRDSAKRLNVSQFVWKCINFRDYYTKCGGSARGNLREIMSMSEGFDRCAGGGLAGFVSRLDQMAEADEELRRTDSPQNRKRSYSPETADDDKIHFMTIHGSKGLEFPVVFFTEASLAGGDRDASIYIDKELGMGFLHNFNYRSPEGEENLFRTVTPTVTGRILKIMKKDEEARELQRKLYVALTRAREKLFVTGLKKSSSVYGCYDACGFAPAATGFAVKSCNDSYDLMRLALSGKNNGSWKTEEYAVAGGSSAAPLAERARCAVASVKALNASEKAAPGGGPEGESLLRRLSENARAESGMAKDLADALLIADGGSLPTKISVSALKRYAVDEDGEVTGEPYSSQVKPRAFRRTDGAADTGSSAGPGRRTPAARSGAAFGTLMHLVMKWAVEDRASWPEAPGDAARYAAELIRRKLDGGFLSVEEAALADPEMLAGFISSPRGREVRAAENVRCEVPFTYMTDVRKYVGAAEKVLKNAPPGDVPGEPAEDRAGYAPEELREGPAEPAAFFKNNLKEEKNIVIQGVVDLYYKLQDRVVIVDFKTDRIRGRGDADNIAAYRMQLTCYRDALADISGENIQECVLYFLRGGQEYSV